MPIYEEPVQIYQYVPIAEICDGMFGTVGTYRAYHTKVLQYAGSIEHHS
jgi:hypothetical protein